MPKPTSRVIPSGTQLSLRAVSRTSHRALRARCFANIDRLVISRHSASRLHWNLRSISRPNGFGMACMTNGSNPPLRPEKQKVKGDPRTLYALDRILGVGEDFPHSVAADRAGSEKKTEGEDDDAEAGVEKMDEEKEEMPLVCDVCGKTPDVEVRKYPRSLFDIYRIVAYHGINFR